MQRNPLLTLAALIGAILLVGCDGGGGLFGPPKVTIEGDGTKDNPVTIPMCGNITADGDLSDWAKAGIPGLPAPFAEMPTSPVHMCWSEKGLYIAANVVDDDLMVDPVNPWTADALEVWLDRKNSKAMDMVEGTSQLVFFPDPQKKEGKGDWFEVNAYGAKPEAAKCMWQKTEAGYTLEIFLPGEFLKPAEMAAGTKMGMNFTLSKEGEPVIQFFSDKQVDNGYANPSTWGTIVLTDKE